MNNTCSVIVSLRHGHLTCYVPLVSGWEGVEKLSMFLELNYGASVAERIDGPDARRWVLSIRGYVIEIHHEDPWGNEIVSPVRASDDLLREIAEDLRRRLAPFV